VSDLQGLANLLCSVQNQVTTLDGKLNALLNRQPPEAQPTDDPLPSPPSAPLPKPAGAIGCVVTLDTLPAGTPQYGTPARIPQTAWAIMHTAYGPLPSVEVKHSPMFLVFPTPLVTDVSVDGRPGVSASVQFIRPGQ
jgi:hypothetical protein